MGKAKCSKAVNKDMASKNSKNGKAGKVNKKASAPAPKPLRKPVVLGYARVSTRDQNLDRQLDALRAFPVADTNIYCDKASGKDFNRPGYQRAMRRLRAGDVLVIKSIDRLGRDYAEIMNEWRIITQQKRVAIVVLDMPLLDTRNQRGDITGVFIADLVLQILSYVAQVERENTRQRQAEGIAAAQARGVRFGRPKIERPVAYEQVVCEYRGGDITRAKAAERLGVCVRTFDAWVKADAEARAAGEDAAA